MREYEVMYILRPDLEEEAAKSNIERYQQLVTDQGGEVTNLDEMGKRRLAYEINDYNEGNYVVMNFKAEDEAVREIERNMNLSDDVIRYLVIREDEE